MASSPAYLLDRSGSRPGREMDDSEAARWTADRTFGRLGEPAGDPERLLLLVEWPSSLTTSPAASSSLSSANDVPSFCGMLVLRTMRGEEDAAASVSSMLLDRLFILNARCSRPGRAGGLRSPVNPGCCGADTERRREVGDDGASGLAVVGGAAAAALSRSWTAASSAAAAAASSAAVAGGRGLYLERGGRGRRSAWTTMTACMGI